MRRFSQIQENLSLKLMEAIQKMKHNIFSSKSPEKKNDRIIQHNKKASLQLENERKLTEKHKQTLKIDSVNLFSNNNNQSSVRLNYK